MRMLAPKPPVDQCEPNPCSHGGTCSPTPTGYTCYCDEGYKGDTCEGKSCALGIQMVVVVIVSW